MSFSFNDLINKKWEENKFLCIGLDSDYPLIPRSVKKSGSVEENLVIFNLAIIDATADLAMAFKINTAFYEAEGMEGWSALLKTAKYIKETYPEIPLILDAKRADIGNTNLGYVKLAFDVLKADAITVHPYLGQEGLQPFLNFGDKGIIVLVRTSNKGAGEFQDLKVGDKKLYQIVAERVAKEWNKNKNCGVVVGATYPKELKEIRSIIGDMPILIPGIGTQGGDLKNTIKYGKNSKNQGMIISSSRSIIFASQTKDFAHQARVAAEKVHNQIQKYINE